MATCSDQLVEQFQLHPRGAAAVHANLPGGRIRNVDNPTLAPRPAVVNPDNDFLAIGEVRHGDTAVKGERAMRGGHRPRIETLAAGCPASGKFITVIAGHAVTDMASAVAGLGENRHRNQRKNRKATHFGHGPLHVDDIAAVDFMPQYQWRYTDLIARQAEASDIQISHIQCVLYDEITPRLDNFAHQLGENIVSKISLFDFHAK